MSEIAASGTLAEVWAESIRPYPPSFVDRIADWVRRLPIPSWLVYLALALALLTVNLVIKWLDGTFPMGTLPDGVVLWQQILGAATFPYALALLHYLDNSAQEALDDFRPAMQLDDAEYRKLRYQFTTLPVRPAFIAASIGALYGVAFLWSSSPADIEKYKFFSSVPATIFQVITLALGYASAGLVIYHSIRQLRMVSRIYTTYARIDLFNLAPVHALSRLAARTAIAMAIISYAWAFINFENDSTQVSASSIFEVVTFSAVIVLIFIWPLLGARRLLREAKARAKTAAQQQFKAAAAELHRRREAGDFSDMGGINEALDGLLKEQSVLDRISTWPWQPETIRGVATAILLPILIWFITRVLERFVIF